MATVSRHFIALCLLMLLANCGATGKGTAVRFPGEETEIASPNGVYSLINVDADGETNSDSIGANHALYLRNLHTDERRLIYQYDRYVEVLWSPDCGKVAINDHHSSDGSTTVIAWLDIENAPMDIQEEMAREFSQTPSISGNHHVYIEVAKWVDADKVLVMVHGYGEVDPRGFELWYEYSAASNSAKRVTHK